MTESLPFEILRQVFSNLGQRSDLVQCMLTSRRWNRAALETLYETINLDDFQENELAKNLIKIISYHPLDIAKVVRKIDIGESMCLDEGDEQYSVEILKAIYEHCPNIQSMFSDDVDLEIYWKLTLEAAKKGKLKHLEIVPEAPTPYFLDLYYLPLVQEIRTKLKRISIETYTTESSTSNNMSDTFHSLFTKTHYPKLESIEFLWEDGISLMDCEHIINCGGRSENFRTLVLDNKINIDQRTSYDTYSRLISSFPVTDIKILNCQWSGGDVCDIHMIYMMRKFPNLKSFSLSGVFSRSAPLIPTTNQIITEQVLISFFEFISHVPILDKLGFTFVCRPNGCRYFLASLLTRDDVDELELEYDSSGEETSLLKSICTFDVKKQQKSNEVSNNFSCKIKVHIIVNSLSLPEDSLDKVCFFLSLKESGRKIKSLTLISMEIFLHQSYVDWNNVEIVSSFTPEELYVLRNGFWFEYVLKHCPSLESFTIIDPGNIQILDSFTPQKHDSIERLTIQYSPVSQKHFTSPYISKVFPALRYLTISVLYKKHCYNSNLQLAQSFLKDEEKVIKIDLPYTSLELFNLLVDIKKKPQFLSIPEIKEIWNTNFNPCYLKIKIFGRTTGEDFFYYKIDGDKIATLLKQNYYEELGKEKQDDAKLFIEIYCSKIGQFRLDFNMFYGETFDINL